MMAQGLRMNVAHTIRSLLSAVTRRLPFGKSFPDTFPETFDRFKRIVDGNNRALEIITDMGEKLGGDYLFDAVYVKKSYGELRDCVQSSMDNFDHLTEGRYERLHEVFNRIDNLIRRALDDVPGSPRKLILSFEDIPRGTAAGIGGKNTNLVEIKKGLQLLIPDAFAVTTHAFDQFMQLNGFHEKRNTVNADPAELSEFQELIIHGEIPPDLDKDLEDAIEEIRAKCGEHCFLAIRSSADAEDQGDSFAGQFETFLNVPLEKHAIEEAYKKTVASLFSTKAIAYQKHRGYDIGNIKMAVGCMVMVDAVTSGVIYTANPSGRGDTLLINAVWGLGTSVVEGQTDADVYVIKKSVQPLVLDAVYGKKKVTTVALKQGGTAAVKTSRARIEQPCLTPAEITELAVRAIRIEQFFGTPQDIEWAIDARGRIFIIQARPLNFEMNAIMNIEKPDWKTASSNRDNPVLIRDQGIVVQQGVGAGPVFVVREMRDLDRFPRGSVLVAKHDSSLFVKVMPFVSAIITETGTATSHMSALCRELKIPTIVNIGSAITKLDQGREITVLVGDGGTRSIYDGIAHKIVAQFRRDVMSMEEVYEYRKKRYILRYISPLNLVDPLMDEFTPERCRTIHDILRFIHEKSVTELVNRARDESAGFRRRTHTVTLDLSIPAGIVVMDIGGGLGRRDASRHAVFEDISSVPFRAIIRGMLHPGAWRSDTVPLRAGDFLTSMMQMSDIVSEDNVFAGYNLAVISKDYLNLSLRFGYHFAMVDCYCSEQARDNHLFFRFVGGATDIIKRSRRVELIATVLRSYGFNIKTKGDLIIARLNGLGQEQMVDMLDRLGRLTAYTRQLDAVLYDESSVDRYAKNFMEDIYELKGHQ